MSGDNLSGLIRSGTSHSVSVSKHTGNAQNPKNIFHSEDEEAGSKKTALKKQHVVESNANIQRVDSGDSAANLQRFATDEVLENVQNVGIGMAAPNLQEFTNSAGASPNQQAVINESLSDNIQKLGQDHMAANMQQVPTGKGFTSRVQVIPGEGIAANQQMINQASTNANKQSAHEAGPAVVNRQPTDKENLKDHFEVLPSSTIESARVNLGNSASQVSIGAEQPSSTGKGKQDDKPTHVTAALASQQVTKTKRDAFLGRLAGIKRDVGSISLKLDAMDDSA
jgi:hypothetical protein